jgi:transcriptional regulator with XRE-family HTH domain
MNRIKELRTERGITQADLAKILKISDRAVGYYENGDREPDYSTLLKIADYFDVSIDYLLGVSDVRNPNSAKHDNKEFTAFWEEYKDLEDADKNILHATLMAIKARKGDK